MDGIKVEILYVTFSRDLDWLRFSLESVRKHATGFTGIKIVVPCWDREKFLQFERYSTPDCPVLVRDFMEYPGRGFLHHLIFKCYADILCPESTHIIHLDPDCLFASKVTPDDYFEGGKPVLLVEPYEAIKDKHPGRYNWKSVTEMALKFDCTHETMCRHPAVHPKSTYLGMRDFMEKIHQTPFIDFVLKQKAKFPYNFGEFNTLGAWAMKFDPSGYRFIDRGFDGEKNDPPSKLFQGWSYRGTGFYMDEIKKILA